MKIQPEDQIGPNNTGKMILRGCFMNVSQEWMENTSGQVGGVLSRYLNNRHGEATGITLKFGEHVPDGREDGPHPLDIGFMATAIFRLNALEKRGDALQTATAADVKTQVQKQVEVLEEVIHDSTKKCANEGIRPMFTGLPDVIIDNVLDRTAVTHAQSNAWEDRGGPDLFEGLTINEDAASHYVPPSPI